MAEEITSPLQRFTELLGPDVFFVPCEAGTKKPKITYTERPKEKNESDAYRSLFDGANIAVYLGKASGGLCAIDFDRDEDLAAFDALNPRLRATLRSRGSRGAMVWVRIVPEDRGRRAEDSGAWNAEQKTTSPLTPLPQRRREPGNSESGEDYPESCTTDHFEWRADKRLSTIWGKHPKGMDYQILCEAAPAALPFGDIQWPKEWRLPWVPSVIEQLELEYGPPLAVPERGAVKINQGFLVGKFLREHDVLFDSITGRFYRYEAATGLWRYGPDVAIQNQFAGDARALVREIKANNNGDARLDAVLFNITHPMVRNLTESLKGAALKQGAFEKPNRVVHAANGMVVLTERPFAFKPFAKEFYSRNQSPIAFEPAAKCPRFLGELLEPALGDDDIKLLQRWCGLALLGRNTAQVMLILSGTAGGGKGTIVNVINGIVGEPNVHQLRTEHLDSRFETSFYHDKTLLYGADVEPNFLNTPSAHYLKSLTGNDLLTTETKGSSVAQRLRGDFNVVLTCNSRLMVKLQGDSEAWARRLLLIEFSNPPPAKKIPNLDRILLRDEGPGILNWMLDGAVELLSTFDAHESFPITQQQRARVSNLLSESDAARTFITTCVDRSPFPLDCVTSQELFTAYLAFCDERGWAPQTQRSFEMKAKDLMVQLHRAAPSNKLNRKDGEYGGQRGYQGVILKRTEAEPGEERRDNEPF